MVTRAWVWMALACSVGGCVITATTDKDTAGDTGDTDTPTDGVGSTGDTSDTGTVTGDPDRDGDGFPASKDCDDNNDAVFPGATEVCDGVDNDCDKYVDDVAAATVNGTNYVSADAAIVDALALKTPSPVRLCADDHVISTVEVGSGEVLTLEGPSGRDFTSLSATDGDTVLEVSGTGMATLTGLTITGAGQGKLQPSAAIEITDTASLTLTDARVSDNLTTGLFIAGDAGGKGANLVATNTEFTGNDAYELDKKGNGPRLDGGAIRAVSVFTISMTDCDVQGNEAQNGGGIWASPLYGKGSLLLTNTDFTANIALFEGGGIYVKSDFGGITSMTMSDGTVSANQAGTDGGGIYAVGTGTLSLAGATLSTNQAGDEGGGLFARLVTVLGSKSATVQANTAGTAGGGAAVIAANVSDILFVGNDATQGGGVASLTSFAAGSTLTNLVVDTNTAKLNGAGLYVEGSDLSVISSTITLNSATGNGGGAFVDVSTDATLQSTTTNWGKSGVNDNVGEDVYLSNGNTYTFAGVADFTCETTCN